MLKYNNKGQTIMIGIMILVMAVLIAVSTLPAMQSVMDETRQCNNLNCEGFVDSSATGASGGNCTSTNRSYNPDLTQNALSCTILDLFLPFLILSLMIGLIIKLLHNQLVDRPEPQQYGYSGGY